MDRSPVLWLFCCWNHLSNASSTSLLWGFRIRFILDPLCLNALIILLMFCQMFWIVEFTRPNSRHTSVFFSSFYLSYNFNFSFDAWNLSCIRDCISVFTLPTCCELEYWRSANMMLSKCKSLMVIHALRSVLYSGAQINLLSHCTKYIVRLG